jgi:hypothetical protein
MIKHRQKTRHDTHAHTQWQAQYELEDHAKGGVEGVDCGDDDFTRNGHEFIPSLNNEKYSDNTDKYQIKKTS